jgi:ornithine racemase
MRKNPRITFDLKKLHHNVTTIYSLCAAKGIDVVGVTKGFSAIPEIARVMVEGGINTLGDSRLENIAALKDAGVNASMMLIRIPMLHEADLVVKLAHCSLNSEITTIKKLSQVAIKQGMIHDIILMVDQGDLREGFLPEDTLDAVKEIIPLKGVHLKGLANNFNCINGVDPTVEKLMELITLSSRIEQELGIKLDILSGGNTTSLMLVVNGTIPEGVNQLRIGEGILLGHDIISSNLENTHQDAIIISGEIIELKWKESVPTGSITKTSFGEVPTFTAGGIRKRAILALGKQDIYPEHMAPREKNITIIAASSDHLVVDVTESDRSWQVGDEIHFIPTYPGILSATTSRYVSVITH